MKLNMSSIKFDADGKLLTFVQKKANKLDTFYDRIIDGDISMKVQRDNAHENKIIDFKINVPGSSLFASEKASSFESATDQAVESLKRQLKKLKGKQLEKR